MVFKRGYEEGIQSLEILEGNIEVIVYNNSGSNYYCYRFKPKDVFGIRRIEDEFKNLVTREAVESYIKRFGKSYDTLLQELLTYAIENNMTPRDE